MRLHPMVLYTFGAVTIWLLLLSTALVALAWESYLGPAFVGGGIALVVTLSMRYIELARSNVRLVLIDEKKVARLNAIIEKHLVTIQTQKARIKTLEEERRRGDSPIPNEADLTAKDEDRKRTQSLSSELHKTKEALIAAQDKCAHLAAEIASKDAQISKKADELHKASSANAFITREFENVTTKLAQVTEDWNSLRGLNSDIRAERDQTLAVLNAESTALTEAKVALEAACAEITTAKVKLGEKDQTIETLQVNLETSAAKLKDAELQNSTNLSDMQEMRFHLLIMGDAVKSFCKELEDVKSSLARCEEEQISLKAELEKIKKWKASVDRVLAPESIKSLRFKLVNLVELLEEDRKLDSPKHSDIVQIVYDAMDNVLKLLEQYEAELQTKNVSS